jgi:hypothetical protein
VALNLCLDMMPKQQFLFNLFYEEFERKKKDELSVGI